MVELPILYRTGEALRRLAIRHQQYGVRQVNYDAVGKAFLWTLRHGLGSDGNEEVQEVWTTCYQLLSATMKKATW